jgi:integrase
MRRRLPFLHRRGRIFYFFEIDESGRRREKSLRTDDPEIASERYQRRMKEGKSGRVPTRLARVPLAQAARAWLEHRALRVSRGTLRSARSIVRSLEREFGTDTPLEALADISRVHGYQDSRLRAGISPKSVNNEVQELASILEWANLWHRVAPNYRPLKRRQGDIADALTPQQCEKIVAVAAESDRFAVAPYVSVLALSTGMRSCEIKGLTLGDLHHDAPLPYLIVRRETTKTDAGARRVALDQLAIWSIGRLLERARELGSRSTSDFLLPTDLSRHTRATDPLRGTGYDPSHAQSSWETEWQVFRSKVGIEHRRFHDLRHTYISRAAEAGIPVAVVQAQVGHLSKAMTDYYTHISHQAQFEATRQIESKHPELLTYIGIGPGVPSDGSLIKKVGTVRASQTVVN